MSEKRDVYEVLGVSKTAGADEIKKAYRKLALQFHPDRNPGNAEAESSFKEVSEAFAILNDEDKRAAYDRYGWAAMGGAGGGGGYQDPGDVFNNFQDLFSDFFGGGFGGGGSRRQARGQDMRLRAQVSFEEAMTGAKKEVDIDTVAACEPCGGSGAESGSKAERCTTCGGQGQVATQRGFMVFSSTCPKCKGKGTIIANPCKSCKGEGLVPKKKRVTINFPAGIDSDQRLRLVGQGMAGPNGAPAGDLYVDVEMLQHPDFERDGADIIAREALSFTEAALGTKFEIAVPGANKVVVTVPPGTQPGDILSFKGEGFPVLNSKRRGGLHVSMTIEVPKKLSKKAKELLKELDAELDA